MLALVAVVILILVFCICVCVVCCMFVDGICCSCADKEECLRHECDCYNSSEGKKSICKSFCSVYTSKRKCCKHKNEQRPTQPQPANNLRVHTAALPRITQSVHITQLPNRPRKPRSTATIQPTDSPRNASNAHTKPQTKPQITQGTHNCRYPTIHSEAASEKHSQNQTTSVIPANTQHANALAQSHLPVASTLAQSHSPSSQNRTNETTTTSSKEKQGNNNL